MAKYRYVHCEFWQDPDMLELTPEEKYFYIYLLTNPHTSQCGIYEISNKQMKYETGYNEDTINKLIERFEERYKKIQYDKKTREILIKNWSEYNYTTSPQVIKCIKSELSKVESNNFKDYIDGLDRVYRPSHKEKEKEKEKENKKKNSNIVLKDKIGDIYLSLSGEYKHLFKDYIQVYRNQNKSKVIAETKHLRLLKEINEIYQSMHFQFNSADYDLTEKIFKYGLEATIEKDAASINYAKRVWISEIEKGGKNNKLSAKNRPNQEGACGQKIPDYD